jgi:hypothetical protein
MRRSEDIKAVGDHQKGFLFCILIHDKHLLRSRLFLFD